MKVEMREPIILSPRDWNNFRLNPCYTARMSEQKFLFLFIEQINPWLRSHAKTTFGCQELQLGTSLEDTLIQLKTYFREGREQTIITSVTHWFWWHIIRIPILGRLRQERCQFKDSQDYISEEGKKSNIIPTNRK